MENAENMQVSLTEPIADQIQNSNLETASKDEKMTKNAQAREENQLPESIKIENQMLMDLKDQPENIQELEDFEQVDGKKMYETLIGSNKLCGPQAWKRVLREVKDVNDDFHSLRTCIGVVQDTIGALHYLLYPTDGALADKPLCGRILIPKDYPNVPPVIHLFTKTNRYNVDVYQSFAKPNNLHYIHSSMCFDMLNSKNKGGTWKSDYTLSALIASLLQAIVSTKVDQTDGSQITEFVTMEMLSAVYENVKSTYQLCKAIMPSKRKIALIEGIPVQTKYFYLPEKISSLTENEDLLINSDPIMLQVTDNLMKENIFSIGFNLSDLKTNPSTVFSIILSNTPSDTLGKESNTVLVRNGVTATAAKKRAGGTMQWFYHGKPMNQQNLKLIVTVGYNQFCISYLDGDKKIIHGDRPVSFLTRAEIGDVTGQPFYLSVFMKNKGGPSVTIKTFVPEEGYVHPVANSYIIKKKNIKK